MTTGISLSFNGLTGAQASALLATYSQLGGDTLAMDETARQAVREIPELSGYGQTPQQAEHWNHAGPDGYQAPAGFMQQPVTTHEPQPAAPALDVRATPWHPDLHAATKGVNADGTWKVRRGADKAAVAAWVKRHEGSPSGAHAQTPATVAANTAAQQAAPSPAPVQQPSAAQLNQQFGAPAVAQQDPNQFAHLFGAAPAPAPLPEVSIAEFSAAYNHATTTGKLTGEIAATIAGRLGITSSADYQDGHKRTLYYAELMKL